MKDQIIEEIMNHFGRTGAKKRPRIRKFHAELLYSKFRLQERIITASELSRPEEYIKRMVKYSKGFIEFINEDALEIKLTDLCILEFEKWEKQYSDLEELDHNDEHLLEQGIIVTDEGITFDGRLTYSRFHKVVSDEGESMNDPRNWLFNTENIDSFQVVDFSEKNTAVFSSRLFLLKFYVLRKIDEVAFVTSRFVHCPSCNSNYIVPSSKIDFQQTYKCEKRVGDKQCKTPLKKFPARKMIPTYIYEIAVEIKGIDGNEFKEFFLESFQELHPGYYTGMCFGRTEQKSNSFYFNCLVGYEEKSKIPFEIIKTDKHRFFDLKDSIVKHIQKVGFIIDDKKAQLVFYVELLKKITVILNREVNLDHSLYFGAPGIGKTFALTLLRCLFYSNSGVVSGPRFTLAGLTGGQKEVYYQDSTKKKNVPGLFSNQFFLFDEINNAQFLSDDKAVNLFKAVVLASSGTSTTVGGKEFPRISLIAATANYEINYLRHYENKIRKIYSTEIKNEQKIEEQPNFLTETPSYEEEIPATFDFYLPLKDYGPDIPKALKIAVIKVRDEPKNYLTNFPKPLMERFYWSILVHPKYDKTFLKQKEIDVLSYLKSRQTVYTQRELLSQLFVPEFDSSILSLMKEAQDKFNYSDVEKVWSKEVRIFLKKLSDKYTEFFSMFNRIPQVHVFCLYALCLLNGDTTLTYETKRIFERLISLCHVPIKIEDFHDPDFENFQYLGESRPELLEIIKEYPEQDIRLFCDYENRKIIRNNLARLENLGRIEKVGEYYYRAKIEKDFEVVEDENWENRDQNASETEAD